MCNFCEGLIILNLYQAFVYIFENLTFYLKS